MENETIGGYRVLRLLGKGGMGEVYEVVDDLGRQLALKVFAGTGDQSEFLRKRLFSEGRLLAKLSHPNLVHVYDVGMDATTGRPFFVMDCILDAKGESVTLETIRQRGEVTEEKAWRWYGDLREALRYCHEHGVVHRDVKLSNVLVNAEGRAVLSDFGVSKIFNLEVRGELGVTTTTIEGATTGTRPVMGTYWYLAPSLRNGGGATAETDRYALGVLFFRLLTGLWYEPGTDALDLLAPYDARWRPLLMELLGVAPPPRPVRISRTRWIVLAVVSVVVLSAAYLLLPRSRSTPASAPSLPRRTVAATNVIELVFGAATRFELNPCPVGKGIARHPEVVVTRPYWLGATPVTRRQWFAVRGEELVAWKGGEDAPMTYVSREEVDDFCARLNRRFASKVPEGLEIRLPTLAEWSLASRIVSAVTNGVVQGVELSRAWETVGWYGQGNNGEAKHSNMLRYYENNHLPVPYVRDVWPDFPPRVIRPEADEWARYSSQIAPVPVGLKPANPMGLHDMYGNCFERVFDRCAHRVAFYGETEFGMRVVDRMLFQQPAPCVTNPVERSGTLPLMLGSYMSPRIPPDEVWASNFEKLPHLGFRLCLGPKLSR